MLSRGRSFSGVNPEEQLKTRNLKPETRNQERVFPLIGTVAPQLGNGDASRQNHQKAKPAA
jgi:hypothetical protein